MPVKQINMWDKCGLARDQSNSGCRKQCKCQEASFYQLVHQRASNAWKRQAPSLENLVSALNFGENSMSHFSVEKGQNSTILALEFYILFYNHSSIFFNHNTPLLFLRQIIWRILGSFFFFNIRVWLKHELNRENQDDIFQSLAFVVSHKLFGGNK